ncbi:DUF2946 domain-containing protein [Pseudocitrobacter cyperus]|uniref:DUF2946 domain-containing protein n=1 Tax=Pseudocitrobacter cyperus TaxID=3112843 RepID=A0ABV0HH24_9ENTR
MLLLAFGLWFIQCQVVIASHDCPLTPTGEVAMIQHMDHQMSPHDSPTNMSLCGQHCVPDSAQKTLDNTSLLAIPVVMALAVVMPSCVGREEEAWSLTPPAAGPPATIRFCRFRE